MTVINRAGSPRADSRRGAVRRRGQPSAGRDSLATHLDVPRVAAALLIIISLTAVHQFIAPLRLIRPSLTLLALLLAIAVFSPKQVRWSNLTSTWPSKVCWALLVISLLSIAFGISPGGALNYFLGTYVRVLVFFAALVIAIRRVEDLALLTWTFVISIGILTFLSVTVIDVRSTSSGLARIAGQGMFDANDIGMVILMGMPLARLVQQTAGRVGRLVSSAILFTSPITIALTGSRGALVGFIVVLPMMLMSVQQISAARRFGILGAMAVVLAVSAPAGYWQQMETTLNAEEDYNYSSDYGRIPIAKRGIGYMMQYPFFGLGVRNFPRAEGTISPIAAERASKGLSLMWVSPHNTFVQVGAELGIPALILWIWMLVAGVVGLLRLRDRLPPSWEHGPPHRRFLRDACQLLPVSFVAFAISSFFLTHLYTAPIYILLALAAGLLVLVRQELALDGAPAHSMRGPAVRGPAVHRPAMRGPAIHGAPRGTRRAPGHGVRGGPRKRSR